MYNPLDSEQAYAGYQVYLKEVRPYYNVSANDKQQDVIDRLRRGYMFALRNLKINHACFNKTYEDVLNYFMYEYAYIASTIQKNRYESTEAYFNQVEVLVLDEMYALDLVRF